MTSASHVADDALLVCDGMTKHITGLTGAISDITGRTGTVEATGLTRVNHTT